MVMLRNTTLFCLLEGGELVEIEVVMQKCGEEGFDSFRVEKIIEGLKKSGDLFEPRNGFLKKM